MRPSLKQTLLVVDDDLFTGTLVTEALKEHFQVTLETSGSRAVAVASQTKPVLILQDLNMPNVDGFEVLRQLKENPLTSTIPVICVSGDSDENTRARVRQLGASGYFKKPLDVSLFAKDVLAVLETLNVVMESRSHERKFVIAFNHGEKNRLLRKDITEMIVENRRTLLLSLQEGGDFCDDALNEFIRQKSLVYLQVLPALVTKFPYLQDFSPVLSDLKGFLGEGSENYALYVDEPLRIINLQDDRNAVARIHSLKETFLKVSRDVRCFSSKDTTDSGKSVLNEMAAIFCR